jgi:hypothetical protein
MLRSSQVYGTLLSSMPTLSESMRNSITQNLNDIVALHDELLGELHKAVPSSEYTHTEELLRKLPPVALNHRRWHSFDAVAENTGKFKNLTKLQGPTADASVAAEVANVFGRKVGSVSIFSDLTNN